MNSNIVFSDKKDSVWIQFENSDETDVCNTREDALELLINLEKDNKISEMEKLEFANMIIVAKDIPTNFSDDYVMSVFEEKIIGDPSRHMENSKFLICQCSNPNKPIHGHLINDFCHPVNEEEIFSKEDGFTLIDGLLEKGLISMSKYSQLEALIQVSPLANNHLDN